MNNEWITWALQGLLGFVLWQVWTKLDKNTNEVQALKELLLGQYMKKEDFETYRKETRDTIHDLRGQLSTQMNNAAAAALTASNNAAEAARLSSEAAAAAAAAARVKNK